MHELQPRSYSTDDLSVAKSYALEKARAVGGVPIVYEVRMDVTKVVRERPYKLYEADGEYNREMGFKAWVNNVPIPLGRVVWKGKPED